MQKVNIAFDIDGTLRKNSEERHRTDIEVNEDVLDALRFAYKCKNTIIHLWSNRGPAYCLKIRKHFGLQKYVKESNCHLKYWQKMQDEAEKAGEPYFRPDIAYDDQQRFDGADRVIVVREK